MRKRFLKCLKGNHYYLEFAIWHMQDYPVGELRPLGKSGIKITSIGLGTWQFSGKKSFHRFFWEEVDQSHADEIVKSSLESGINWFDTAEIYGNGRSERILAKALQNNGVADEQVHIATKWRPVLRRAKTIKTTFPQRVENLSPYSIDLHQIHMPASISPFKAQLKEMGALAVEGKIGAVGISNFGAKKMREGDDYLEQTFGIHLASNQMPYSLVDRKIETDGVMDIAKERGITIIAYSPLGQGFFTNNLLENPSIINTKPFARRRRLKKQLKKGKKLLELTKDISEELQTSMGAVALRWLLQYHGEIVVAIPGATKPWQATENAKAMSIKLSTEQLNALEEASQPFL